MHEPRIQTARSDGPEEPWRLLLRHAASPENLAAELGGEEAFRELFQKGLEFYAARDGAEPDDDIRLCRLAIRAGELATRTTTDLQGLFADVAERSVEDVRPLRRALGCSRQLDEKNFFKAALLLLWLESERNEALSSEEGLREVLGALDSYRFSNYLSVDSFLNPSLVAWLLLRLATRWPALEARSVLCGFRGAKELVSRCRAMLTHDRSLAPRGAVWNVLEGWLEAGDGIHDAEDAIGGLVALEAEAGERQRAHDLMDRIPDPFKRSEARATLVRILVRAQEADRALALAAEETDHPHLQTEALGEEVAFRIRSGDLELAQRLARAMEPGTASVNRLIDVAEAWCQAENPRAAKVCLEAVVAVVGGGEFPPALPALVARIATACREAGIAEVGELEQILRRLQGQLDRFNDGRRSLTARTQLARAWTALDLDDQASSLVECFDDGDRSQSLVERSLEIVARTGDPARGVELLQLALEDARMLGWNAHRAGALLHVAFAFAKIRAEHAVVMAAFYEAITALRDAIVTKEDYATSQLIGDFFLALAGTGAFSGRLKVFEETLEAAAEMKQEWWKSRALLKAPTVPANIRDDDECRRSIDLLFEISETLEGSARSDVMDTLIPVVAKRGFIDTLIRCLDLVEDIASRAVLIGLELGARGRGDQAEELLLEILPAARDAARRESPDAELAVVQNLVRSGRIDRAQVVAETIKSDESRSLALSEVVIARLLERDAPAARDAWIRSLAVPTALAAEDLDPESTAVVVSELAKRGDEDGLESLYRSVLADIHAIGGSISPRVPAGSVEDARYEALLEVARQMTAGPAFKSRRDLLHTIHGVLERIPVEWKRASQLRGLAKVMAEAGEFDEALDLASGLDPFSRAEILATIARAKIREGSEGAATELLREVLAELRKLLPPRYDYSSHSRFVEIFCEMTDQGICRDLMEQAVTDLEQIELDTKRAYTLLDLGKALSEVARAPWVADLLARMAQSIREAEMSALAVELDERRVGILATVGEFDEALSVARAIDPMLNQQARALCRIIRELVSRRLYDPAFQVFDLIAVQWPRVEALQDIVKGLTRVEPSSDVNTWSLRCLEEIVRLDDADRRSDLLREWLEAMTVDAAPAVLCEALERELPDLEKAMYRAETEEARASTLQRVVTIWALLGNMIQAFAVLEKADAGEMAASTLSALADIVAKRFEPEDQRKYFNEILSWIEDFESDRSYFAGLVDLADAMVHGGLTREAVELLGKASLALEVESEGRLILQQKIAEISEGEDAVNAKRQNLAERFPRVAEIESEEDQVKAIDVLAQDLANLRDIEGLYPEIDDPRIPSHVRHRFVSRLQKALLEQDEPPLSSLRRTLCYFPLEGGLARVGARRLAAALLKSGHTKECRAIVRQCPELGLVIGNRLG